MIIAINASLRRNRRRLGLLLAAAAMVIALLSAHGAMAQDHMGGMGTDGGRQTDAIVSMCLGVAETAAVALGAAALAYGTRCLRPLGALIVWPPLVFDGDQEPLPGPRARPPDLSLLQVLRL